MNEKTCTFTPGTMTINGTDDICMCGKKLGDRTSLEDVFTVTEKLDGIRCLAICKGGTVTLLSRSGKPINGCENVRRAIISLGSDCVLDGELIAVPMSGESRKKTYERTRADLRAGRGEIQLHCFDILTLEEFRERRGNIPYLLRRDRLDEIARTLTDTSAVTVVPVLYHGQDLCKAREWMKNIQARGGEGVMINLDNAVYQFGRTNALLKLKPVADADLQIIDILPGTGRNAGRTGAIVVEYKGERVGVSSGLTAALRKSMFEDPGSYIGRIATVRYAEESTNAAGKVSLRFPVFVELREVGKSVSYA